MTASDIVKFMGGRADESKKYILSGKQINAIIDTLIRMHVYNTDGSIKIEDTGMKGTKISTGSGGFGGGGDGCGDCGALPNTAYSVSISGSLGGGTFPDLDFSDSKIASATPLCFINVCFKKSGTDSTGASGNGEFCFTFSLVPGATKSDPCTGNACASYSSSFTTTQYCSVDCGPCQTVNQVGGSYSFDLIGKCCTYPDGMFNTDGSLKECTQQPDVSLGRITVIVS